MMKRLLTGVSGLVLTLLIVLTINTLRYGAPRSQPSPLPTQQALAVDIAAAAERLAEAIQLATISYGPDRPADLATLRALHALLGRHFPKVQSSLRVEIVNQGSLLFAWQGSNPTLAPILFLAHMDVVPAEDDWAHPPFDGVIAEGAVWGRGALDTKSTLMSLLEAVEFLLSHGATPKRTVYLAFGHDEEIGGRAGARKIADLLASRGVRLDYTLDEGGIIAHSLVPGVTKPVSLIGVAEKGRVNIELIATAAGGHASMPPQHTAIGRLAGAIQRLEEQQMTASLVGPVGEMFRFLAPELPVSQRVVLANAWLFEPLLLKKLQSKSSTNALIRTTTAATLFVGGVKANALPSEARATLNFRILPGDSISSVIAHVRKVVGDPNIIVRAQDGGAEPSLVASLDAEGFAVLRTTVAQAFPDTIVAPTLTVAATDSVHYATLARDNYRFSPLRLTPADLKRIHGKDERITLDNYAEMIRFYVLLLQNAAVK